MKKPKALTLKQKVAALKTILVEIQKKKYHYPNPDWHEYCAGCQRSPYNVPPHEPDCLVPRLAELLKKV